MCLLGATRGYQALGLMDISDSSETLIASKMDTTPKNSGNEL